MVTRTSILALLALCAAACGGTATSDSPAAPPNVVLVVLDTTRADRCSPYGYGRPTTPALASIAAEGALFLNTWAPSPWTGPAHASLFTGLRPEHHGFLSGRMREYLRETPTLAGWFRAAGLKTACMSNSPYVSREFGLDQGFDLETREFEKVDRPGPPSLQTHREALAWVRARRDAGERFFLFVNDLEPHSPYTPPEELERAFLSPLLPPALRERIRGLPWYATAAHMTGTERLAPEEISALSDLYDGEVACVDRSLGVLVEGLRNLGVYDDTVVVVMSDHGESFGEHGCMEHVACLHRPVLQVPLVVRYPPRFTAGTRVSSLVRVEDVAPTLLQLALLKVPAGLDGESFLGPVGGRVARASYLPHNAAIDRLRQNAPLVNAEPFEREIRSVMDGRWHYILSSAGGAELYDLSVDPLEETNLAAREPEQVARLASMLPAIPGAAGEELPAPAAPAGAPR